MQSTDPHRFGSGFPRFLLSWLWVGVPMGWGVWETVLKSLSLFR